METLTPLDLPTVFFRFGIALALGLLVGLQRQRAQSHIAGFRTFPLATLAGALCALLAPSFGPWVLAAGLAALAVMIAIGNLIARERGEANPGITTEVALLLMFLVGAAIVAGWVKLAVVLGGTTAVLLQWKQRLHSLADKLEEADVLAATRFVLIALIVWPVLPDRAFGPFEVLNLHEIWWMVVLIVGMSLAGYAAWRWLGPGAGTLVAGVLGGLISSTATTASYARRTRAAPKASASAAIVVLIASTVLYARVLVEVVAVAPSAVRTLAPPLAVLFGVFVILCALAWLGRGRGGEASAKDLRADPAELRPALLFALVYAAVLLAVAAARHYVPGDRALYAVAALSGLTDVDAITLSTARLVESGGLEARTGWRLITVASISNLVFKAGMVAVLGARVLFARIAVWFGAGIAAAVALLALYP